LWVDVLLIYCSRRLDDTREESEEETDNEEKDTPRMRSATIPENTVKVGIDYTMSAFANARYYYENKKQSLAKHERTVAMAKTVGGDIN
jgi:predicted ribosome quality control (RQC) complex YloA/Tae2 family protein